jgi:ATP-dependent protease ClpP protease subunit
MKYIPIFDDTTVGSVFAELLACQSEGETEATLIFSAPDMSMYIGLAFRDLLYTFKDALTLTAVAHIPPNLNELVAITGLPVEQRKITKSNLVIFVKETWFIEGSVSEQYITHSEKLLVENKIVKLISESSKLTEENINNLIKDGKVVHAKDAIEAGLFGSTV